MAEHIQISREEFDRFKKYEIRIQKQEYYQKIQSIKGQLQSRWARENGCPIDVDHAKKYYDLSDEDARTIKLDVLINMVNPNEEDTDPPDERDAHGQEAGA